MSSVPVLIVEEDIQFAGNLLVQVNSIQDFYCAQIFKLKEILSSSPFSGIIIVSCTKENISEKDILHILHNHPEAMIVLYRDTFELNEILRFIKLGVHAFYDILSNDISNLLLSLREHGAFISPKFVPAIFNYFTLRNKLMSNLTKKEKEIFQLVKDGLTYEEIAKQSDVSINTVRFHIKSLYRKFNVKTKVQLINSLELV